MNCETNHKELLKVEEEELGSDPTFTYFICSNCGEIIHEFGERT